MQPLINPNIPQKLAADPRVSSWVSASAGTGKTKVLTDRLLNLLLQGTDPSKIVCLTFTKAAASEMQIRLYDRLREWVLLSDTQLTENLRDLRHQDVSPDLLHLARSLFTKVLELPGRIKILTIHSFCQNILSRFPLEAAIPPHFSLLDDSQVSQYLRQAMKFVFSHNKQMQEKSLHWAASYYFKESSFQETLEELLGQRHLLRSLIQRYPTAEIYAVTLVDQLQLPEGTNLFDPQAQYNHLKKACQDLSFDKIGLIQIFQDFSNSDDPNFQLLERWVISSVEKRVEIFDDYCRLFLTKGGELLKRAKINHPYEGERLIRVQQDLANLEVAQKSLTLYTFGHKIFEEYQRLKEQEGLLDYDDLIEKTLELLNKPDSAAWVLYKLDGGIDHILIDEAQDTNPLQWQVVLSLANDFFRPDRPDRTFFVVGDAKQSIYSFQGAKPEDFISLRSHFAQISRNTGYVWRDVDLTVSFRSTPDVLGIVDAVFDDHDLRRQVLSSDKIVHFPHRQNQKGKVALWPLVLASEETEDFPPWSLPDRQIFQQSLEVELAHRIADQVLYLFEQAEVLPSTREKIQPKDILILVKQRTSFVHELIIEFKKRSIPIAGADRFYLTQHIAVQDLIVLGDFLLQPLDDLALATILRSPFINMLEEELESLCLSREKGDLLWYALIHHADNAACYAQAYEWLKDIMSQQDYLMPYELYSYILYKKGGKRNLLSRLTLEAQDVLTEFLNQAYACQSKGLRTLQSFLAYLKNNPIEIKRDSSDNQMNQIRIMTIHGSKGLQAPIVIIPEKLDSRDRLNKLLWEQDEQGRAHLMITRPPLASDSQMTSALKVAQSGKDDAEDKRLLYVALTRAQDHLYLCGYGKKNPDDSWYSLISEALEGEVDSWNIPKRNEYCPLSDEKNPLPECLQTPIDFPLQKLEVEATPIQSESIARGLLIHKLLEDLPFFEPHLWKEKASVISRSLASTLDLSMEEEEIRFCVENVLQLLENQELGYFFGSDSIAELEVLTSDQEVIRLDRVVIGDRVIKILDYKSTTNPPDVADKIARQIVQQLDKYKKALSDLYPDHAVECYILWTHIGRLDRVEMG